MTGPDSRELAERLLALADDADREVTMHRCREAAHEDADAPSSAAQAHADAEHAAARAADLREAASRLCGGGPLDNRYIDPEYAAELARVLRLMASGDFSPTWSTAFNTYIARAPSILEVAANQIERFGKLRPPPPAPEAAPSGRGEGGGRG